MEETLNKLKQFESTLKMYLMREYGAFIPEDKITLLNTTSYINNLIVNDSKTIEEYQGELTRRMLDDLIDVECEKEIMVSDDLVLPIPYGESLEDALIEYYAHQLSEKYGFNINEIPQLKDNLDAIELLKNNLGTMLDIRVFNENAIELLLTEDLEVLSKKYDEEALKKYLEKNANVLSEKSKEEENEFLKGITQRDNSLQIVWINDRKNIKYTDQFGIVHLVDIENNKKIEDFYNQAIKSLKPGEKLDSDKLFSDITFMVSETHLTNQKDIKRDELTSNENNMLNHILVNSDLQKPQEYGPTTHSEDLSIHIMQSTNDIIATQDKGGYVESQIIKDGTPEALTQASQDFKDNSSRLLSIEEMNEYMERYASGEELSREELEQLRRAITYYEEQNKLGPVLKPKEAGFTSQNMALYFVMLAVFLALLLGALIFQIS